MGTKMCVVKVVKTLALGLVSIALPPPCVVDRELVTTTRGLFLLSYHCRLTHPLEMSVSICMNVRIASWVRSTHLAPSSSTTAPAISGSSSEPRSSAESRSASVARSSVSGAAVHRPGLHHWYWTCHHGRSKSSPASTESKAHCEVFDLGYE